MDDYVILKDLDLISYLRCLEEVKLVKTEVRGKVVFFYFSPKERVQELINAFYTNTAPQLSALALFNAQRETKNLIFSLLTNDK